MKQQVSLHIARSAFMAIILLSIAGAVRAQYVVSAKAGIIQFTAGNVFLDDKQLDLSKLECVQMENGQTLRTERGLAELILGTEVYLRLGQNGLLRMDRNRLNDTELALEQGSALVEVIEKTKGTQIRIRFAAGLVEIKKKGLYRLDGGSREVRVYGGEARVEKNNRKAKVKSGKMIRLDEDLRPTKFDPDEMDSLHQWAALRSFTLFVGSPSTRAQEHWTHISMGWLRNYNYRMSFRAEEFQAEWIRSRLSADNINAAAVERVRRETEARAQQEATAARIEQARRAAGGVQ